MWSEAMIPLIFIGLAFGSIHLIWRAMASQGMGERDEPTAAADPPRK